MGRFVECLVANFQHYLLQKVVLGVEGRVACMVTLTFTMWHTLPSTDPPPTTSQLAHFSTSLPKFEWTQFDCLVRWFGLTPPPPSCLLSPLPPLLSPLPTSSLYLTPVTCVRMYVKQQQERDWLCSSQTVSLSVIKISNHFIRPHHSSYIWLLQCQYLYLHTCTLENGWSGLY